MSIKDDLIGAKGGGGSFRNRPDTLRSTDTFEALIGLASGPIRGLAPGGLKNLFLNDVPVEDGDGTATFPNFVATMWNGDPAVLKPIQLSLGGSSGAQGVQQDLANPNQSGTPGDWHFGTVVAQNVDFIDLRFVVQQLFRQDKKGVYEETATIQVEVQPSGSSTWINPLLSTVAPAYNENGISTSTGMVAWAVREMWDNIATGDYTGSTTWKESSPGNLTITGKTTSPYIKELRIAVPNTGAWAGKTWTVRCRLMERDTYVQDQDEEHRNITWESIAGVSSAPIGDDEAWRGLAYLAIQGKASEQITGVPEVTSICDLNMFKVPPSSVWDPETRTYTGSAWDGVTYQVAWSQDPAWRLKDLIEDGLSGISALVPGSTLNKWDTLEASKWFSQQVPDGKGGTHCRYSANFFIDQPMAADEFVNYLAGAVGSIAWDEGDGKWRLVAEKPENPVMLFTKENIVGEFNYSHTDIDSRFNDITGVLRNEEHHYEEDRIRVFDQASIDAVGRKPTSIALVGCTNRQEGLRRLKLRLLTSLNETRMVTFATNRQGRLLAPFSTILIADGDLGELAKRSTGRIIAVSADRTVITVRDTIRLEQGISYSLKGMAPNTSYQPEPTAQPSGDWNKPTIIFTAGVANSSAQRGDVTQLVLDTPLPANAPENMNIALEAVGLPAIPKQYKVLNVKPDDNSEMVTVTALEIYTSKWAESDAVNEQAINSQKPSKVVPSPTAPAGGMFSVKTFTTDFGTKRVLVVNWNRPATLWLDGFRVDYRLNQGPWVPLLINSQEQFVELQQAQPGVYDFRIFAIDKRGAESLPLTGSYEILPSADDIGPPGEPGPPGDPGPVGDTGPRGPTGPTLDISAPIGGFTFLDGVLSPASPQTITVSAVVNGAATAVHWDILKPDGSIIRSSTADASSIAVTDTDLGANASVQVRGTYLGAVATVPLGRFHALSTNAQAVINYQKSNALDANGTLLSVAADGVLTISDKKNKIEPEIANIVARYTRYRAQAVAQGVSVVAFDTAYNNLGAAPGATTGYLAPYNASTNPNGTSIRTLIWATAIDLPTFKSYFSGYYDAEAALVAAMNAKAATTADWGGVTGSSKPADNAGTTMVWTSIGSVPAIVSGNGATRTGTSVNDYGCCIAGTQLFGTAYVSLPPYPVTNGRFIGLDDNATDYGWGSNIKYALEINGAGSWQFESDGVIQAGTGISAGAQPVDISKRTALIYTGGQILVVNGSTVIFTMNVPEGQALYPKVWLGFFLPGETITDIQTGYYSNTSWSLVSGANKPTDNATSDVGFTAQYALVPSQVVIAGNKVTANAVGSGFSTTNTAATIQSYVEGFVMEFTALPEQGDAVWIGVGPTNLTPAYSNHQWAFVVNAGAQLLIYENGNQQGFNQIAGAPATSTWAAGDTFKIIGDGVTVSYYHNGVLVRQVPRTYAGTMFRSWMSVTFPAAGVTNWTFKPNNIAAWAATGGVNKPADNATVGADWNSNLASKPSDNLLLNTRLRLSSSAGVLYASYVDANGNTVANIDTEDLHNAGIDATRLFNGPIEAGSDKTSNQQIVVNAPDAMTISYDYTGTTAATGQLPALSGMPIVTKGGVSVRTTSSFSATFNGCTGTIDDTSNGNTRGQVTINSVTSNTAWVDIVVTIGTLVLPFVRLYITKKLGSQPQASQASGGSGTGPASNSATIGSTSSANFVVGAGPIVVRAGAGGKINISVNTDYDLGGTQTGSSYMVGKVQIRPIGGTMTDVGLEQQAATPAQVQNNQQPGQQLGVGDITSYPGNLSFTRQATGLTPGNDYEIQLLERSTAGRMIIPYDSLYGTAA